MNKIEEFIFDIFGLMLPGLIFIAVTFSTYMGISTTQNLQQVFAIIDNSFEYLNSLNIPNYVYITFLIISAYLIGHIIKVMSKYCYDILSIIFDNFLLKIFSVIRNSKIFTSIQKFGEKHVILKDFIFKLIGKVEYFIFEIFSFKVESFSQQFQGMYDECVKALNEKFGMKFYSNNKSWYPFYKSAKAIAEESKVKTHARFFLAKYNFYRSLSFIALLHFVVIVVNWNSIGSSLYNYRVFIIITDIITWTTFHVKYKRYWVQCGNEAIVGLYHSLFRVSECTE